MRFIPQGGSAAAGVVIALSQKFGWTRFAKLSQEDDTWAKGVLCQFNGTVWHSLTWCCADVMGAVATDCEAAGLTIGYSMITYGNATLEAKFDELKASGWLYTYLVQP